MGCCVKYISLIFCTQLAHKKLLIGYMISLAYCNLNQNAELMQKGHRDCNVSVNVKGGKTHGIALKGRHGIGWNDQTFFQTLHFKNKE